MTAQEVLLDTLGYGPTDHKQNKIDELTAMNLSLANRLATVSLLLTKFANGRAAELEALFIALQVWLFDPSRAESRRVLAECITVAIGDGGNTGVVDGWVDTLEGVSAGNRP